MVLQIAAFTIFLTWRKCSVEYKYSTLRMAVIAYIICDECKLGKVKQLFAS